MDSWAIIEMLVRGFPVVASAIEEALNEGKYDEATAKRVRKILPTTSESAKAASKLRARKRG